jgi:uncharacterized membrane protein
MEENPTIDDLFKKVNQLTQKQESLKEEIAELKKTVYLLKYASGEVKSEKIEEAFPKPLKIDLAEALQAQAEPIPTPVALKIEKPINVPPRVKVKREKTPIEEFIGTNLLNKVGIAILVLGISYGVKYSIDHELINPITRIILGYLAGLILIGIAIKIKPNYKTFSAVLLSGGMAALYFITFAAYDLYALFPQAMAFILMVLFTAFTVYAAIQYDQKVIAIIGLVGAYGVPFLLSDGSGRVVILFSYMTIVNVGILLLAFRKAWKQLYYLAFGLTWLIFAAWYFDQFSVLEYLWISLIFSTIFFVTFYITFLAYKLIQSEPLKRWDIVLLMLNSFIYFGFGYFAIQGHPSGELFLGLFTVFNAILHFVACYFIYTKQNATKDTFYFVAGMVLVFLTLAVPVQLEGNWVTLVWAAEAALLFWIGRTKSFPVYERLSYIMIFLAVGSLFDDWNAYHSYSYSYEDVSETFIRLFLNIHFLTSMLVVASLGWILKLSLDKKYPEPVKNFQPAFTWVLSGMLFVVLYLSFYKEIDNYWTQIYAATKVMLTQGSQSEEYKYALYDNDKVLFKKIVLLIYSALFGIALSIVNWKFIKNNYLTVTCLIFNVLVLFSFAFDGLASLGELRSSFINQTDAQYYFRGNSHIIIRYIALIFILPLLWFNRKHIQNDLFKLAIKKIDLALFHIFILILLSSEVVHWLELSGITDSFKLGLSILWGAYALLLIVLGLKQDEKYLRVMAIVLFSVTLIKLFLYDMADMSTISKTIVMIILGVLLLVASFLYNKVKKKTDDETKDKDSNESTVEL